VNNLWHSARAKRLRENVPKHFWHFVIAHAAYIHNVTSLSRIDKSKTIFELLFSKRTDFTEVPPYDSFTTVYKNRRTLHDQRLDLPSDQCVFIGIAKHNGVIGYCVSDGSRIIVTRQNLAFDPHLYRSMEPLKIHGTTEEARLNSVRGFLCDGNSCQFQSEGSCVTAIQTSSHDLDL